MAVACDHGAAIFLIASSHRPVDDSSVCQQPGSPGCPQQFRIVTIFFILLRKSSQIFL